ncbi:MAG TPA: T9SS type A sorting domain-containing protein [Candidatus Kapabacteria bacterium]|nr:T9SS type A sorting domain-containing protein [Candidatus Kapabacteria bacterium]
MNRIIYALPIVLLLCGGRAFSQRGYYTVTTGSGAYTELDNPTVIVNSPDQMASETAGYGLALPFAMDAFGQHLDFNQTPPSAFFFVGGFIGVNIQSIQRLCIFDGFISKLAWHDSTSSISYQLQGTAGERVLKVQWKSMGMTGNRSTDFVNLQIWLSEKDNSYEVHVGPNHVTGTAAYYNNSGPAIGGFLSNYDFSVVDATVHLIGNPTRPSLELTQAYYPMAGTPGSGTVYHFAYQSPASVEPVERGAEAVAFHPNPCTDNTVVELPEALEGSGPTLAVFDVLGHEVIRMEHVASGDRIERGSLPDGMYYVTLTQGGRTFNSGKLILAK